MKLHSDARENQFRISAYDRSSVTVAERRLTASFVLTPGALVSEFPLTDLDSMDWNALRVLHGHDVEILILGTGARQRFPASALMADLAARRIGLEVMSTPAACRTYNILAAERRRVAAVMLIGAAWC